MKLQPGKCPSSYIWLNLAVVNSHDFATSEDVYILVNKTHVITARPQADFPRGFIGLNDIQRTWMRIALTDTVDVQSYDPFAISKPGEKVQAYLGSVIMEVSPALLKRPVGEPLDHDELALAVNHTFRNQIFSPGQALLLDFQGIKLKLTIRAVGLVNLANLKSSQDAEMKDNPRSKGILSPETVVHLFKDPKSQIDLKVSSKSVLANPLLRPNFNFDDLGIGGLDNEFLDIFRRAFATRVIPPSVAKKLNIHHVRGMLLHGPPGTGKTLIARQIGKMLNAREPKVINGPEVLNKYVGQSEENIRKLFADAVKEQKEKGDESGLHIIIFDELDAVCKQRGSGVGGGTGVGDGIVNQLLTMLDGVDQLHNILVIGMTNRKDLIDDALLRPGRLEVLVEINLPSEAGRAQILNIHTAKMRENRVLADNVNVTELASLTRNFSGAEIEGLVRSATSFALQRHIKGGISATLSDDIDDMQVNMNDFRAALGEVKPAFGASESALDDIMEGEIIEYSPHIATILEEAGDYVAKIRTSTTRLLSVLIHGPPGSGKTALAARIAMDSEFPFIRLIRAAQMIGMSEQQKVQHIHKVFMDAYKSPLSVLVLDKIELIIDWVPIGMRFSSVILSTIKSLLDQNPPKGRALLVLATTSERTVLQQLQLDFMQQIPVPNLQSQHELAKLMQASEFEERAIPQVLSKIEQTTGSRTIGVGVKRILEAIKTASLREDMAGMFAEIMCKEINEANARIV